MHQLVTAFGEYLHYRAQRQPSTVRRYTAILDKFTEYLEQSLNQHPPDLAHAEVEQLARFLENPLRSGSKQSKTVWNGSLAALRAFYEFLRKKELVADNPARDIDRLKYKADPRISLSLAEIVALAHAAAGESVIYQRRNEALVKTGYFCGLRAAELLGLDVPYIDFVRQKLTWIKGKGGKVRQVSFPKELIPVLEQCILDRSRLGARSDEPAVFVSDRGTRMSIRRYEQLLHDAGERAEISQPVYPHLLRHSIATELAGRGVSVFALQQFLGHESIGATQVYVHLLDGTGPIVDVISQDMAQLETALWLSGATSS